ncbi:unnamed protein product [Didymodactylos carnosus]|uniref:Uncharacterized protein n=1 Tax=Didymodactylos carnosus TaxID=1234261 RepID=A0A815DIP4_9BILA|nr:unnamed protein product [Didymodactylos carnosus]CAF1298770.1 unnamed protein product [Didymodactylos carnosus]CAF3669726.1 unnamed protein product [Didymodactylos carnosus]CAF4118598.1 unnamed protein product [Didymodactylos carnosus]
MTLKANANTDLDDEQRVLIPHPLRELTLHCIYKGIEVAPVVGLATVLPYQLYKSKRNPQLRPILSRVGTMYGAVAGAVLSVTFMHAKLYQEKYDEYRIWDRSYRLRHSQGQLRADRYSLYSAIVGGVTGFVIGLPTKFSGLSGGKGALLGIPFGLLVHLIQKPFQEPTVATTSDDH